MLSLALMVELWRHNVVVAVLALTIGGLRHRLLVVVLLTVAVVVSCRPTRCLMLTRVEWVVRAGWVVSMWWGTSMVAHRTRIAVVVVHDLLAWVVIGERALLAVIVFTLGAVFALVAG